MKRLFFLSSLLLLASAAWAQTEVKGAIERVTVFPNSALVEKYIVASLQKGENKFVITGNALTVSTADIHFSASPDWFISSMYSSQESLSTKEVLGRSMPQAAYNQYMALKAQADDVSLRLSNANLLLSTLNQQAQALNNLKALRNTAAFDTIASLKAQFEYQRKELPAINTARTKATQEIEELTAKQRQLAREMDQLLRKHTGGKTISASQNDIHVTIYSNRNVPNARIAYSYRTEQVRSAFSYDVMLDEARHQAVFALKSNLWQSTGEHWTHCPLLFSTAEAGPAGYDRALSPYYIGFIEPVVTQASEAKASLKARNTMVLESVAADAAPSHSFATLNDLSVVGVQTLSREYALQTPQTVASGDMPLTLLLHTDTTTALFARYATPKLEEKVHFTALLPEWENLGLLETSCNVYLNNRFVSLSSIVTSGSGDTMRFAVGQDPNVLVNRRMVKSSPDKGGLLSKEITETVTVSLTLKNTKSEVLEVNIKDQIPISSASDLKVIDVATNGGLLDESTGIVRWRVPLQPKEQKVITLTYSVRYPKEKEHRVLLR